MNRQEVFETWKRHKERIEVPREFSEAVMIRVRESRPTRGTSDRAFALLNQRAVRPWVKAAVVVIGVSIGLARILMTLQLILFA
jgi:hypothetical protein